MTFSRSFMRQTNTRNMLNRHRANSYDTENNKYIKDLLALNEEKEIKKNLLWPDKKIELNLVQEPYFI